MSRIGYRGARVICPWCGWQGRRRLPLNDKRCRPYRREGLAAVNWLCRAEGELPMTDQLPEARPSATVTFREGDVVDYTSERRDRWCREGIAIVERGRDGSPTPSASSTTCRRHTVTTAEPRLHVTRDMIREQYEDRYKAINDALWLVQRGPVNPVPPSPDERARASQGYDMGFISGSTTRTDDPRYAEVSLALDIARFLLNEELDDDEDDDS